MTLVDYISFFFLAADGQADERKCDRSTGLSTGAIVGISIGCIVLVVIIVVALYKVSKWLFHHFFIFYVQLTTKLQREKNMRTSLS